MTWLTRQLRDGTDLIEDDVWVADSTPVECGRSRETVHRSDLAGYAEYGYRASHSRYFWGLRLHLLCTLHGLPVGWAVTGAKADERLVLMTILDTTPGIETTGATVIADKKVAADVQAAEVAWAAREHVALDRVPGPRL